MPGRTPSRFMSDASPGTSGNSTGFPAVHGPPGADPSGVHPASMTPRKLPRQAESGKVDSAGVGCLGRKVSGGTPPRLSCGRRLL